jgi:pimeloyl-ACP methyl ester carboxylesterase
LINGYAGTGADWDPSFLAALAGSFTVICPDNRGTGGTELATEGMTVSLLAGDIAALLDGLGISRAHVVGWSMGGFVAQELAAGHPERVGGLVLAATDPGGREAVPADAKATARLLDSSGAPRAQATRLIKLLFPAGLAEQVDAEFGGIVAAARAELSPATLEAQGQAIGLWHAGSCKRRLAAIVAPTLVIAGRRDIVIPPANAKILADGIAMAREELFSEAGHGLLAQQADAVADSIRAHLEGDRGI